MLLETLKYKNENINVRSRVFLNHSKIQHSRFPICKIEIHFG